MKTPEEFLAAMGDTFHIRLRILYDKYSTQEEKEAQLDDDVMHYDFDELGKYTITWKELREKSNEETSRFLVKNDVKIEDTDESENN